MDNYSSSSPFKTYEEILQEGSLPESEPELLYGCVGNPISTTAAQCARIRVKEWTNLIDSFIANNSLNANNTLNVKQLEQQYFWHLLWPVADCTRKDRIGKVGEGGKWICNSYKITKPCTIYSFGAEDDVNFEKLWTYPFFGCKVVIFDPIASVIKYLKPLLTPNMTLESIGLGPIGGTLDQPDWGMLGKNVITQSLANITQRVGLGDSTQLNVLKIDIEGSETFAIPYLLLKEEPEFDALHVGQILLEFHHGIGNFTSIINIINVVKLLAKKEYFIFNMETNNYKNTNGMEVAFVHVSLLD